MSQLLSIDAAVAQPHPVQAKGGSTCGACRSGASLPFTFSMAFQPIIDLDRRRVFAYEALVRGTSGQSAGWVLGQVTPENRYLFDQRCRVSAIELASRLGLAHQGARLSVNFMPGAVYSPAACIQRTLQAAEEFSFPLSALIFEITESERVKDPGHMQSIVSEYRRRGFTVALDDFGAGYSSLNMLAELEGVDEVKLDRCLITDLDSKPRSRAIVQRIVELCRDLDVQVIAEGVETLAELEVLRSCGVSFMQGYLFSRPAFECLPEVNWPDA